MKISIIGASAGIGLATLKQALAKGHTVTSLSRSTDQLPEHQALIKIKGSSTIEADLEKAITGADAVIISIGTKSKGATTLFTNAAEALIRIAAKINFTSPILVITGFGAGESSNYLSFFMRTVIHLFLKKEYENKTQMELMLSQSKLKWVVVRPGMLTNGDLTKAYSVIPKLYKGISIKKIARADVADFLLKEAENPTMLNQYISLSGR